MKKCLFIYLITIFSTVAFTSPDDCKLLISDCLDKLNKNQLAALEKGLFLDYSVKTVLANEKSEIVEERVKLFYNNKKSYISTSTIDLYKDQEYQVSIIKDKKKVIIMLVDKTNLNDLMFRNLAGIQDSLIKYSKITSCANDKQQKHLKEITAEIDGNIVKKTGIQRITFWIEPQKTEIRKISMNYKGKPVSIVEMNINQTDFNYSKELFKGSSLDMVMSKNGKLLPSLSSYTLVDLRKKPQ